MADDQDNSGFLQEKPGDLRIPVSVTIPWRRTPGGQLWPLDRKGRYWPEDRWGHPECPFNELPPDFPAPGTGGRQSLSLDRAIASYQSSLDTIKAAYDYYGSQPVTTLTVRPEGSGAAHPPAQSHRPGSATGTMVLSVGGAVVAAGEATAILAALAELAMGAAVAATAAIVLEWLGKRWLFAGLDAVVAFVRKQLSFAEGHEALIPPPPTPVLPPPPPPPMNGANPGFDPAPPMPAQPGFTPAPPTSLAPPETTPGPRVSPVMESRNHGLEGGARTHSRRARDAARRVDPAVVRHLPNAEWVAHHLINLAALRLFPDLVRAAVRAGWRTDDEGNVVPLPNSAAAQERLRQAGIRRPLHNNGHFNANRYIEMRLNNMREKFKNSPKRDNTKIDNKIRK